MNSMEHKGKVFGIGLSKTGTTSLASALEMLGYKSIHARSADEIETHEASTDVPVAARYRQLDKLYPGSRFILTVRDVDSWVESCRKHFNNYSPYRINNVKLAAEYGFCRGVLYGIDHFDPDVFRAAYQRHTEGAREYFRDRPNDCLELNIIAGEGFDKLCPFLSKPTLQATFPKANEYTPRDPHDLNLTKHATQARVEQMKQAQQHLRLAVSLIFRSFFTRSGTFGK
ncbi:MAG: sulfotransferase family protein [Chloroflexota bacterium]